MSHHSSAPANTAGPTNVGEGDDVGGITSLIDIRKVGAAGWGYAHAVVQTYPWFPTEEEVQDFREFLRLFGKVFTCKVCVGHYARMLERYPLTDAIMQDKLSLNNWLIDRHNEVNVRIKKPTHTFESVSEAHWGKNWRTIFNAQRESEKRRRGSVVGKMLTTIRGNNMNDTKKGQFSMWTFERLVWIIVVLCLIVLLCFAYFKKGQ